MTHIQNVKVNVFFCKIGYRVRHTPRICLHNAYGDFVFLKLRNSCSAVCLCSLLTMLGGACK